MSKLSAISALIKLVSAWFSDDCESLIEDNNYHDAVPLCIKECNENEGRSCTNLGILYRQGQGVGLNYNQAKTYFEKACKLDDGDGCAWLGELYEDGLGVSQDKNNAKTYYAKACNLDSVNGCVNFGASLLSKKMSNYNDAKLYFEKALKLDSESGAGLMGLGLLFCAVGDEQQCKTYLLNAKSYLEKECNSNNGDSCIGAGLVFSAEFVADYNQAKTYFVKSCNLNYGGGCHLLGKLYENIFGDEQQAKIYFSKACALGEGDGCFNLGLDYVTKGSEDEAKTYLEKACSLGRGDGCAFFANFFLDASQAKKYYEKACDLDSGFGCAFFADSFLESDVRKAKTYYEQACDLGSKDGCYKLATLYINGQGVRQNFKTAKEFYGKACDLGEQDGCDEYKKLNEKDHGLHKEAANVTPPSNNLHKEEVKVAPLSNSLHKGEAKVGNIVAFGHYYSTNNKVKEPLRWRVLSVDGNKALLITENCIDAGEYHHNRVTIDWEGSDIRKWLNHDFIDTAFNGSEQKELLVTNNINNAGAITRDTVFLLSVDEAKKYFHGNADRKCRVTKYAKSKGTYGYENPVFGSWWLRGVSCDVYSCSADSVLNDGRFFRNGYVDQVNGYIVQMEVGVRPAIWLSFKP